MTLTRILEYLAGRKTNLAAAVMFTMAVTAAVNDWGEAEIAAFAAAVATTTATLRAAIGKPVVLSLVGVCVLAGVLAGCAGFYEKGPDGTSAADDVGTGVAEFSLLLPPPFNVLVPAVTGLILIGGAAVVRSQDPE